MQEAPPQPEIARVACPRCGAPAEPGQLLCLECGARLAIEYRRPPSWRLPAGIVAGVVLLAGAALAVALAEIGDDAERIARAPAPTQQLTTPGEVPAPPGPTETQAGTTTAPPPAGTAPEPPAPKEEPTAGAGVPSWPDGTSAYTVILLSTDTRPGAAVKARDAIEQGIQAGVLRSDDYSSLRPGYWVAYGGEFDSEDEAQREAERYASLGFGGAYVRFVNGGG